MQVLRGVRRAVAGLVVAGSVMNTARADDYTAAFYTRGTDVAFDMDRGDEVFDPFYVPVSRWSFLPRVTLTASREDNIFLNSRNPQAATTVNLAPGALTIYGRPDRNHFYLEAGALVRLYDSSDSLDDRPSLLLVLGGVYKTGRSQIHGRTGYRRLENTDTLAGARIVKQDLSGNAAVQYRWSAKSSLGAGAGIEWHDFDNRSYVDYTRIYGSGRLYHQVTPKSDAFVQGGVGRDNLDSGPDGFGDADFFDVSLGVRGRQSPKTRISGRVGYQWREYPNDDISGVSSWIAALGLATTPLGFTTWQADLQSEIRPAISDAGSATINRRLSLGANRRLMTERLRGNAAVYAGQVEYRSPRARPDEIREQDSLIYDRREDDYWGYSLGLDWWTRKNVSVGLNYAYTENRGIRNQTQAERERTAYDSGRWTLRVSWNY